MNKVIIALLLIGGFSLASRARANTTIGGFRVNLPTGQNVPARNPKLIPGSVSTTGERLYSIEAYIGGKWTRIKIGDTQVTHGILPR